MIRCKRSRRIIERRNWVENSRDMGNAYKSVQIHTFHVKGRSEWNNKERGYKNSRQAVNVNKKVYVIKNFRGSRPPSSRTRIRCFPLFAATRLTLVLAKPRDNPRPRNGEILNSNKARGVSRGSRIAATFLMMLKRTSSMVFLCSLPPFLSP